MTWTPLLGRFMLSVTWENVLEHVAGASNDPHRSGAGVPVERPDGRAHLQELEAAGYSRTTLRTLDLVLNKAFGEQTGRTLGARKPRETDDLHAVWTLAEACRFLEYVGGDRLYPMWRLLLVTGLRRAELCGLRWSDLEPDLATLHVCRQRVVEEPTSRVREKPPKSHNSTRTLLLDAVTPSLR